MLLVVYTAWTCPGGLLAGFWPAAAKPLVCSARPAIEAYDPARAAAARRRVVDLGPPAQLYALTQGVKIGPPLVDWATTAVFKETK